MANLLMPLQIERQYGASLDADYSFDTLEELKNYATTSALSYSGQILYCKGTDTIYKVNNDKTDVTELGGEGGVGHIELTQAEYDALSDEEKMNGKEYRTYDTGHIYKLGIEYGKDIQLSQYGLVSNAQNFKIDLTKNNPYWYGFFTFSFMYGTTPCEITVSIVNDVYYTITKGQNLVSAITYTQDGADYTIGIDLTATVYGTQVIEMPIEFGIVNSFTAEQSTGDTSAIFKGYESKIITSLSELGLTAPTTVGEIYLAVPDKSMFMLNCNAKSEHVTDVPVDNGLLTIEKWNNNRFRIEYNTSLGGSVSTNRKWIGTLKGTDGTDLTWKEFAYLNDHGMKSYSSLADLGLDTTATLKDITRVMAKNSMIAIKVDAMANQSEYNNITQGTVTIYKIEDARIQAIMTEKSTGRTWTGTLGGENTITGWKELRSDSPFHRVVAQGIAGYFKFKPTSTGTDQSLRISVTDNYGGMINISGATPSSSQYKPFKCIRLSNGEYTNYDAIKVANNKMLKLFYHDGYFYLKVTTYTTCTFTGLIEAPTYVETFDEENAEQIPIRSVFDTPYNDGYADPSIICIGDTDSSDGVIKTLSTLGFTGDVMTWDTGVYRVSHVGGLTNLPATITEEKPGIRLEHYDMKKWGGNHNPNVSTYGCRQSVLHYKGNVFVRYTESGATAGVLITDTGWQKLAKVYTTLAELGLTADATVENVIKTLPIGGKTLISTHEFTNYQTLFPYSAEADKFATLKVEKGYDNAGSRTIVAWIRKDASRIVYGGLDSNNVVKWWNEVSINGVGAKTLVTNAQNFKLDITKKNANYYGFFKLEYLYGYHLCEICIGISSTLAYTVTKGKNLIDKITYTIDGANIIFGIDFTSKVYGIQVVEMPSSFGTINSLTAESFTGSTVANQTGLDLELYKQTKVITSLDKGTWQVGQRIKQKTDFTASTDDVCFEFVAKNESSSSNVKQQKMTIYQLSPIENGTNASTSYSVYEDGKAQVTVWPATQNMPRNDYNIVSEGYLKSYVDEYVDVSVAKKQNVYSTSETIAGTWVDGKTIYKKTIKYTFSSSSSSGSSSLEIATITGLTHLISATGVYQRTGYTDFAIPYSKDSNNHMYVTCNPSNRKIFLTAAGYNSGDIAYVTVEYIK